MYQSENILNIYLNKIQLNRIIISWYVMFILYEMDPIQV